MALSTSPARGATAVHIRGERRGLRRDLLLPNRLSGALAYSSPASSATPR